MSAAPNVEDGVWGVVEDEGIIVYEEWFSSEPSARIALQRWMARNGVQLEQVQFERVGNALTCGVRRYGRGGGL